MFIVNNKDTNGVVSVRFEHNWKKEKMEGKDGRHFVAFRKIVSGNEKRTH